MLAAGVAIGITGLVEAATGSTQRTIDLGNTLRKISSYIFFVLCILVVLQTVFLVRAELTCESIRYHFYYALVMLL